MLHTIDAALLLISQAENVVSINGKHIGLLEHGFHAMYSCNRLHTMDAALLLISQAEILDLKVQLGGI